MRASSTALRAGRLAVALAASIVVVLGAPYTGQIRGAIQDAAPGQYRIIIGGIVVVAVAIAVLSALLRIREQRATRYGLLAIAVGGGALYAWATATGNANVDVVERFHLVEYGALTWLYYRAWHERGDITSLVFPALAAFTVGIFDEGLQWLVPARVGELHDVLLNAVSIACGVIFSVGLAPVRAVSWWPDRRGRRSLAVFTSAVIVALAAFFHAVHLGHEIDDPQTGDFLSRYSAEELLAASRDRAVVGSRRRRASCIGRRSRTTISPKGVWHVQRRNEVAGPAARVAREPDPREVLRAGTRFSHLLDRRRREVAGGAAGERGGAGRDRSECLSQHRESLSDLHLESGCCSGSP